MMILRCALNITRPNRSTRSEDNTQLTTLLNQNEHNDSISFLDAVASLEPYQESKSVTLFHFNKDNHFIALVNIIRHH